MGRTELHATILSPETRRLLIAFARRRMSNAADVEDVVQEALLSASRGADSFEARGSAMRWLYQIVQNAGRMQRRAQSRTRRGGRSVHVSLDDVVEPSALDTPERALLSREALTLAASELSTLPEIDRELVWRYAVDDVSVDRLAADANITRAAVKSRMFRARRALHRVTSSDPCAG